MIRFRSRWLAAVPAALALVVGGGSAAWADPGNGAAAPQVIQTNNQCSVSFGIQDCVTQNMTTNTITTKTGNTVYVVSGTYSETFTDVATGNVLSNTTGSVSVNQITKDGTIQVLENQTAFTFSANDLTCTYSQNFSFSNGVLHFDNITSSCN